MVDKIVEDIFRLVVVLIMIWASYSLGHWYGYGKGASDNEEYHREIEKIKERKKEDWPMPEVSYKRYKV